MDNQLRVLVVEEDTASQRVLTYHLGARGCQYVVAESGAGALDALRKSGDRKEFFDLALIDSHLPDIDGDELIRQLVQEPRAAQVPLVAIATNVESGSEERPRILELGAADTTH